MILHCKVSQAVKIKVLKYINIYLLMNLLKLINLYSFSYIYTLLLFIHKDLFNLSRLLVFINFYFGSLSFLQHETITEVKTLIFDPKH